MYFLVFLYLFGAAVSDKRTGKIPNGYLLFWMEVFLAEAFWKRAVFSYLFGFLAVLCLFFPLFFFHMMGAGDIKLMALLGAVFGICSGLEIIFAGLSGAAVWSLFYLVRKRIFLKRIGYFLSYVKKLAEYADVIWQGQRPPPYFNEVRDGREAAFCFAPFLLAGYLLWLFFHAG